MIYVSIDGATAAEITKDLQALLSALGQTAPRSDETNGTRPQAMECPEHHKAKQGQRGLYCPTKLPDGSWCKWNPKARA